MQASSSLGAERYPEKLLYARKECARCQKKQMVESPQIRGGVGTVVRIGFQGDVENDDWKREQSGVPRSAGLVPRVAQECSGGSGAVQEELGQSPGALEAVG